MRDALAASGHRHLMIVIQIAATALIVRITNSNFAHWRIA
jgi:hypothetical protein